MIAHKDVWEALFAIQGEVAELTKNADNPFYRSKYVPLPDLLKAVLPLCQKHGVLLTQPVRGEFVNTTFRHVASDTEVSDAYPLHCADKSNPQALGTSVSYARRYGLKALGAIIELDDDGNAASTRPGQSAPQNAAPRSQSAPPRPVQGGGRPEAQGRAPGASGGKDSARRTKGERCPDCGRDTVIRGRPEYGGGRVCWKGAKPEQGCGHKFTDELWEEIQLRGPVRPHEDLPFEEGGYGDALADDFDPTK